MTAPRIVPEFWLVTRDVSKAVTVTLPSGAAPGTRLTVRRIDLAGAGVLTVLTSGDDKFLRPGDDGRTTLVLAAPFEAVDMEYARMPIDGKRETEGVWFLIAPELASGPGGVEYEVKIISGDGEAGRSG